MCDLLLARHTSYGPFVVSNGTSLVCICDQLQPCNYYYDVRALIKRIRVRPDVDFVVFVGPNGEIITALSTKPSCAQFGRAMYVNIVPYKNDVYLVTCVSICAIFIVFVVLCTYIFE
jgi:hypothetical protein